MVFKPVNHERVLEVIAAHFTRQWSTTIEFVELSQTPPPMAPIEFGIIPQTQWWCSLRGETPPLEAVLFTYAMLCVTETSLALSLYAGSPTLSLHTHTPHCVLHIILCRFVWWYQHNRIVRPVDWLQIRCG